MADRPAVLQVTQVGVESTPGTAVAATQRLTGTMIRPSPATNVRAHRGVGSKVAQAATSGYRHTVAAVEGQANYNDLVYLLTALLGAGTFGTNTVTWVPSRSTALTPKPLTVEWGSAAQAEKFAYGMMESLKLRFTKTECAVTGQMFGRALSEAITLTASVPDLALVPIAETEWELYLGAAADLSDLALLTRVDEAELNFANVWMPRFFANQAQNSFTIPVEKAWQVTGSFQIEADATGNGFMTALLAGTGQFLRIKCTGPGGASAFGLAIDIPIFLMKSDRGDNEELGVNTYSFEARYVAAFNTTGGFLKVALTSDRTAL